MEHRVLRTDELSHHGILGMKWGVRRYQNSDGTLTDAGKKRYYKQTNKELNKLSNKIVGKHLVQVDLFNSYPYEDEVTRKINNEIYKETVDSLVADLKAYKKGEDFIRSIGEVPVTGLEKNWSFIKTLYADSPYRDK